MMARITTHITLLLRFVLLLPRWVNATSGIQQLQHRDGVSEDMTITVPSYNFTMPVDHFNEDDTRTYSNRYWMNDTYYKAGGPVFFYDFGETLGLESSASDVLAETGGPTSVMQLARRYHGMAIGWEHRYYGTSQPFPGTIPDKQSGVNGTKETWQYLTNEQALEDTVYFAHRFAPPGYTAEEATVMSPKKIPWVFIGGSYGGNRAAWIRIRNPETFYAAWASSAPVQTRFDGHIYFNPIASSLASNCSADVTAVIRYADDIMSGNHGSAHFIEFQQLVFAASVTANGLNSTLNLTQANTFGETQIATFVMSPFDRNFQSYGPSKTTDIFCSWMQSYNPNATQIDLSDAKSSYLSILTNPGNNIATDEGLVKTYNVSTALHAYMYALRKWQAHLLTQAMSSQVTINSDGALAAVQSWTYQFMTQFGWIRGSSPTEINIISKFYNYTYVHDSFYDLYPDPSILPPVPDVQDVIDRYGGWHMRPSNIMFTNGEYDPWRAFSVMSAEADDGAPMRNITQVVPACNETPCGNDVFGLLHPGAVHVQDLKGTWGSRNDAAYRGLTLFSRALDNWIACFQQSTTNNTKT